MTAPLLKGVGLGLRSVHYRHVLARRPAVPWFEATTENYLGLRGGGGGRPLETLLLVRRDHPLALHGVSLNIGSADPLDEDYLRRLKDLAAKTDPAFVSDHLCWTGVDGRNLHDLLPLPYTEEALRHLAPRVRRVQDALGRRILLENVSSYLAYRSSEMTEWEFLSELARRADCGVLLDINNIHVSAVNQSFDPRAYVDGIPRDRVGYMHLAGPSEHGGFLIDTHDHPVPEPVWDLYAHAVRRLSDAPALIEWDDQIPPFDRLAQEAARAERIRREILREPRPVPA